MHYHSFSVLFEKDNESFSFAVHRLKGNSPSLLGKPAQKFVLGGKTPHNLALKTPHRPSKHSITHVHRLSTKTQLHFSNRPWRKLHAPDITVEAYALTSSNLSNKVRRSPLQRMSVMRKGDGDDNGASLPTPNTTLWIPRASPLHT
jgi:hypothetical protein